MLLLFFFFFSSRRRHTRCYRDWSSDVCSSDLDRRDSERVRIQLLVRDSAVGGSFEPYDGNLALGGVWFESFHPPVGSRVEVRFLVPGARNEIRAQGEVL